MVSSDTVSRWRAALKLPSWPKLMVPAALGQAMGFAESGRFSFVAALAGAVFVASDTAFIVLLNDWADREVDTLKRRRFPTAGSKKTIPDGLVSAPLVLFAALFAGAVGAAASFLFGIELYRPWLAPLALGALLIFVCYSLPPLALNYRGGGELLEAVGVGGLLPSLNAYLQSGSIEARLLAWLPGLVALSFASAVASGLSDEMSDREGGKNTFATWLGNARARRLVEASAILGGICWMVFPLILRRGALERCVAIPAAAVAFFHLRRVLAASPKAVTNAFREQAGYKEHLHRAIWRGALVLAGSLVLLRVAAVSVP